MSCFSSMENDDTTQDLSEFDIDDFVDLHNQALLQAFGKAMMWVWLGYYGKQVQEEIAQRCGHRLAT